MAAMVYDHNDCVDNRLPFWSGKMLKQLKTLLNTPGKSYDDLMADPNWPVWMFDYESMRAGIEQIYYYHSQTSMQPKPRQHRFLPFRKIAPGAGGGRGADPGPVRPVELA